MAVVATELKNLTTAVNKLFDKFDEHVDDDKKVELKVNGLEQRENANQKHFWVIYPTIVGTVIAWCWSFLTGGLK
jgi:hypothetical protein